MADPSTYRPKTSEIPTDPGVYRFRDEQGAVIYVGKAKNLRARLTNYFQDLANQACILRPSLTGILTRLEKAGLVVRLKPSNDQRRVYLKLTNEGEKLFESIGAQVDERYDAIEQVLSKEKMLELKELLTALSKIEQHLK